MAPLLARTPSADRQFERIYQRYVGDVYRYTLAVLRNAQDAEDVTQTTFMNAYRAMQNGERPETPKNWLITIAHNACRQRFRQAQRRPQESPLFEDSAEVAVPEHDERYSAEDIQRALGQLAFNQRAALVMRELEGRSYAEIAEIMGTTVGAVETVLFRARRALREQLEGSLSCSDAELFLSKQADGRLNRSERGQLRAHLRECKDCDRLARQQRASRGAIKAVFGAIPLPTSLWGGGAGVGLATKAAAVVCAGAVVGGGGYEAATHVHVKPAVAKKAVAAAPAAPARVTLSPSPRRAAANAIAPVAIRKAAAPPAAHKAPKAAARRAQRAHPVHPVTPAVSRTKAARPAHPAHPVQKPHPVHPGKPAQAKAVPNKAVAKPNRPRPAHPDRAVKGAPKEKPAKPVKPVRPTVVAPPLEAAVAEVVDEALQPGKRKGQK